MCGRYVITPEGLIEIDKVNWNEEEAERARRRARYNVAPTQSAPVIIAAAAERPDFAQYPRRAVEMRWGLLPRWAKDASMASKLINARAEGLADKPSFRDSFRHSRCLVPAAGFYEWGLLPGGGKQAFFIHPAQRSGLCFAGLSSHWRSPEGEKIDTYCVITTEANLLMSRVHARMPVILDPADYDRWLGLESATPEELVALLHPAAEDLLALRPVSSRVNSVRNEGPELIAELSELDSAAGHPPAEGGGLFGDQ